MFYLLLIVAIVLFIAHVALLFTSFPKSTLLPKRYFYSHLTLWLTGGFIFILALLYGGSGRSAFLDYFNSPLRLGIILAFTFALSLVAHTIVQLLVLPMMRKKIE